MILSPYIYVHVYTSVCICVNKKTNDCSGDAARDRRIQGSLAGRTGQGKAGD